MPEEIEKLKVRVPDLVRAELFAVTSPEEVLNSRDSSDFGAEWMRVHNALSKLDEDRPMSEVARQATRDVEQTAFKAVYDATGATEFTEFAPAVSEDFGLFARALFHGYRDTWLNGLFAAYQRGAFPSGRIQPSERSLGEQLVECKCDE